MDCMNKKAVRASLAAVGAWAVLAGGLAQAAAPITTPKPLSGPERSRVTYDSYILGPGDSLQIELLDIP